MVPSRLYPLILLMEMYDRQDRVEEARKVAEKVISMPVNQNNLTMIDLHDRARSYLKKNHHEIVE